MATKIAVANLEAIPLKKGLHKVARFNMTLNKKRTKLNINPCITLITVYFIFPCYFSFFSILHTASAPVASAAATTTA